MKELERARRDIAPIIIDLVYTQYSDTDTKPQQDAVKYELLNILRDHDATVERLVREDERQKCVELAWQMQSKEGRSEIGNAITVRAEEKP